MGSLLACPFFSISLLYTNFWVAMVCTAGKYLLGENFWSPNIMMIQKSGIPTEKLGGVLSVYQFMTITSGAVAIAIFGSANHMMEWTHNI